MCFMFERDAYNMLAEARLTIYSKIIGKLNKGNDCENVDEHIFSKSKYD